MDKWTKSRAIYHKNHIIIINWQFCQINKRKLAFSVKISFSKKYACANMKYEIEIRSLKGYRSGVQYMRKRNPSQRTIISSCNRVKDTRPF